MAAGRYDIRRQLVVNDANALGGLYLQSSLLPDPPRKAFKQLLRQYVDLRAQVALSTTTLDAETARTTAQSGENPRADVETDPKRGRNPPA